MKYTDCFWQLPVSKECVHAIPKWLFSWEFLVLNKPYFITENTHHWTNSSRWLFLLEGAWRGAGSHCHGLPFPPWHVHLYTPRQKDADPAHVLPRSNTTHVQISASRTGKAIINTARTPLTHSQVFRLLLLGSQKRSVW